jgi:hypothetical protein
MHSLPWPDVPSFEPGDRPPADCCKAALHPELHQRHTSQGEKNLTRLTWRVGFVVSHLYASPS